jgi:large subunit ribosomal protein L18
VITKYKHKRDLRRKRVRSKISGTASVPRLSVFRSNKYIYAQLVDDTKGHTLISVCGISKNKLKKTENAHELGKELAKKAIEKKIKNVVFDRNGYRYLGRVQSFAEGAREGGLEF